MKTLIKVETNKNGMKLVSARELYLGLGLDKSNWKRWSKKNIIEDEFFLENQDYIGFVTMTNGNETKDFAISLDMAKHLSMMARTKKSHEYRQYFIECEKENKVLNTILDNTTDKQAQLERNEYRFSEKRTIKTFSLASPLEIPALIKEFNEYLTNLDTTTRRTRYQSAIKGIERIQSQLDASTVHMLPLILVEKEKLIKSNHILENRSNGGIKSHQTRKITSLEEQLQSQYPSENQFITLNTHGYSNNYQYAYVDGKLTRTYGYNKWISKFPVHELPQQVDIDTTKPLRIYIHYIAKAEMDIRNMDKSFIDRLQVLYEFDDNLITEVVSKRVGTCQKYSEGQISFYIENVEVSTNE